MRPNRTHERVKMKQRLPRTRGDRPVIAMNEDLIHVAPPHTRGSTQGMLDRLSGRRGSPAHAGIDPLTSRTSIVPGRLPRTRGDRPAQTLELLTVALAPPHTRGSTRITLGTVLVVEGSPAHAGIDPLPGSWSATWERLPRTRGDRPAPCCPSVSSVMAPPHTRGSTQSLYQSTPLSSGSPAHAGIDPCYCLERR